MNKKVLVILAAIMLFASVSAFAQGEPPAGAGNSGAGGVKWGVVGASFVLGIAAAAGAIGQSRAIAASVEGIARNPSAAGAIRLSMIIGLALIESLVIYALVLAFFALNK
ncbi:MAG: F0F1 ATP synthase subunit C [Thermoanaerobaculia bacterium]